MPAIGLRVGEGPLTGETTIHLIVDLVGLPPTSDPRGVSGEIVTIFANGEKVFEGMVYDRSPVVAIHNLQPGEYVFYTPLMSATHSTARVTVLPRTDGSTGDDVLVAADAAAALFGSTGNDTLVGGSGGDLMYGGEGADLFVVSFVQSRSGGTLELFRNGASPSDRANEKAWSNYAEHARAAGFSEVVGHTAGGRALYGRMVDVDVSYQPLSAVDTIRDFSFLDGDRISIQGVTSLADFIDRVSVTREGDGPYGVTTLALEGRTFLTIQTGSQFDPGWFVT